MSRFAGHSHRLPEGYDYDRKGEPQGRGPILGFQAPAERLHQLATDLGELNRIPLGREPSPGLSDGPMDLGHLGVALAMNRASMQAAGGEVAQA